MKNLTDLQKATGLRRYTDGIKGAEVHHQGQVVYVAKNKPAAEAFMEGFLYAQQYLGRSTPAGTERNEGDEN